LDDFNRLVSSSFIVHRSSFPKEAMPQLPTVPHDSDAEDIILGNCLLSESLDPLAELGEEHFYSKENQKVVFALRAIGDAARPINLPEVVKWLQDHGNSVSPSYVSDLADVPSLSPPTLEHYRGRLRDALEQRAAMQQASDLAQASTAGATVEEIHDRAVRIVEQTAAKPQARKAKKLYPEVPAEAWRGPTELYRQAVAESTEAPDVFHLFAFLTGIGALLGRSVYTHMGRRVYPNIFLILVGEAGRARKGTALEYMLQFMEAVDPDVYVTAEIGSGPGFIEDLANAQEAQQAQKRIFNELRVVLSLDEFRALIEKASQKATGDITPLLCKSYDCPAKLRLPVRTNKKEVNEPTLAVMAGTSPSYLQNLSLADIEGGLGSRLTFVPGDPKPRKADPPDPDTTILNPMKGAIKEIIDYYRSRGVTRIGLTKEAHERWVRFYEKEYNPPGCDPLVMTLSERDHMTCRKLALILTTLDKADATELYHLNAAISMVTFLYEARFPVFAGHGLSPAAQDEAKIVEKVKEAGAGGIGYRNLQRSLPRMDKETFHRRMKWLTAPDSPLRIGFMGVSNKKRYVYLND
jgi:hypothetical protein